MDGLEERIERATIKVAPLLAKLHSEKIAIFTKKEKNLLCRYFNLKRTYFKIYHD